jgi:putative DNA primase/helicase
VTRETIEATLTGYAYVAYTTYAHKPGSERWRVFVPAAAPMDADTHLATWVTLNAMFAGAADPAAKDATRLSYLPGSVLVPDAARIFHAGGALFIPVPATPPAPTVSQGYGPVAGWDGPTDDAELIAHACNARTRPDERLGGPVHFAMLWTANAEWLTQRFPSAAQPWDYTQADMALAGELAYWTGSNAERMANLMRQSGLAQVRVGDDDWNERKVALAVERACRRQERWAFMKANVPVGTTVPPPPTATAVITIPKAQHRCTDQANAERLHQQYGDKLIACAGTFYAWDGKRWKADDNLPQRFACELSRIVRDEATAVRVRVAALQASPQVAEYIAHPRKNEAEGEKFFELEQLADALDKWSTKCEMKSTQDAALGLLKKLLSVDVDQLDANEWLLNCDNGTVDLRTGEVREQRAADYITRLAPVTYDPNAQAPRFRQFLHEIFVGDAALVDFLGRWFGYASTGSVREEKLVFHWGKGRNGKTTLIETVESVLGDYATTAPPGILTAKNADERHPAEIADLHGRRMVTASESEEGAKLREAFIKLTTGGDRLKGRRLYGQLFQFRPTHKLQLLTNHKPEIRGSDFAIWSRILLVAYTQKFGSPEQLARGEADHLGDSTLKESLKGELPGVLTWIVEGARQWHAHGLRPPDVVLAACNEYRTEQDRVGEFIRDCCRLDVTGWVAVGGLYRAYQTWCTESGIHPLSRRRFMTEVERSVPGLRNVKQGGSRGVTGIELVNSATGVTPAARLVPPGG